MATIISDLVHKFTPHPLARRSALVTTTPKERGTKLERRMATYADPAEETHEEAGQRLDELLQKADKAHATIFGVYQVALELNPQEQAVLNEAAATIAQHWSSERSKSPLPETARPEQVKEAIEVAAKDYFKVFTLYRALRTARSSAPGFEHYRSDTTAFTLYKIYANHVINAAEARFIGCGMDPFTAHRINGYIKEQAADVARKEIHPDAYLEAPLEKKYSGFTAALAPRLIEAEEIDHQRNAWRLLEAQLPRTLHGKKSSKDGISL